MSALHHRSLCGTGCGSGRQSCAGTSAVTASQIHSKFQINRLRTDETSSCSCASSSQGCAFHRRTSTFHAERRSSFARAAVPVAASSAGPSTGSSSSSSSNQDGGSSSSSEPSIESRAVGVMLGALCGNVLGAPVQYDRHWMVTRLHPDGLTNFWAFDLSTEPMELGQFTGDYSLLLATARSVSEAGTVQAEHMARHLAALAVLADQAGRRYPEYGSLLLEALVGQGAPLEAVPHLAEQFLEDTTPRSSNTASDRPEKEPYGPSDNGGAARIAPVAVAYRSASPEVLEQAVYEACLFSHTHPIGLDGARVAAAAVAWLLQHSASSSTPQQLLEHLMGVARTEDMVAKLKLMHGQLFQVGHVTGWRQFYRSQHWSRLTQTLSRLTYHDYATAGTEGVAVALWALCTSWQQPEQAVIMAATFAGSAPVTSQLTGAFAGALHGDAWLPARWLDQVENGHMGGRDEAVQLGKALAVLQCTSVGQVRKDWEERFQAEVQEVEAKTQAWFETLEKELQEEKQQGKQQGQGAAAP